MNLTIAVTGHRDLVDHEVSDLRSQVKSFFEGLRHQYPGLQLQLLSGLAEGADQLVAEVALELGVVLIAVLPFGQADYEKTFDSSEGVSRFRSLLTQSRLIQLPDLPKSAEDVLSSSDDVRALQYAQLGVFISNHCQVLLALWDGKVVKDLGGTSSVMNYHLTAVMPGFSVDEESANLLADNENDLAFHIVCSRNRPHGEPVDGLEPLQSNWVTAHFGRQDGHEMPPEYSVMLRRLETFDDEVDELEELAPSIDDLLEGAPGLVLPSGSAYVNRLFGYADFLAARYQRKFVRGLMLVHLLAVTMGLVFIVFSEFGGPDFLVLVFLALFGAGIAVHVLAGRAEWHRKYLDYRALAEGLRVQTYWNVAGVVDSGSAEFAYDNFLQKQDVDLAWIRHVMRSASLERERSVSPDDAWVDWVVRQWVGSSDGEGGQLGYYSRTAQRKTQSFRRTARLGSITLWSGIMIAVFIAIFSPDAETSSYNVLMILMGVLPLIAAVQDAYSHKRAEQELIKQYHFMNRVFENARRLLNDNQETSFRRRVLRAVGNAALEEHAEWILMHRDRPLEHGRL